jgi:hypothetical protein
MLFGEAQVGPGNAEIGAVAGNVQLRQRATRMKADLVVHNTRITGIESRCFYLSKTTVGFGAA